MRRVSNCPAPEPVGENKRLTRKSLDVTVEETSTMKVKSIHYCYKPEMPSIFRICVVQTSKHGLGMPQNKEHIISTRSQENRQSKNSL